jgi:very-short-patch-repair endonuclease
MKIRTGEYIKIIKERARNLRKSQTVAESLLWNKVRNRQLKGLKFFRQHPIVFHINGANYFFIADLYCHQFRLIIEIDGSIHDKIEQREYDWMREETLKEMGFRIIRFRNKEIIENVGLVIKKLIFYIKQLTPSPSLKKRGSKKIFLE